MRYWGNKVYCTVDTEDALNDIGDDNILKYCYKEGLIEPKKDENGNNIYPDLGKQKNVKDPKQYIINSTEIYIDSDDTLDSIDDDDIRNYCLENSLVNIDDFLDEDERLLSEETFIKNTCSLYKNAFTKRFLTKEDLKKELSELIDIWIN